MTEPSHVSLSTSFVLVGLMSGTSADGIDVAVIEISRAPPKLAWRLLAKNGTRLLDALKQEIFAAFQPTTATVDRFCTLNFTLVKPSPRQRSRSLRQPT